ncbi:hypothetical protein Tco_0757713, partial [Tanacetum coccineum]
VMQSRQLILKIQRYSIKICETIYGSLESSSSSLILNSNLADIQALGGFIADVVAVINQELLALGEQIGNVSSSLSDDFILQHLKTRVFATSKSSESEDALCVA